MIKLNLFTPSAQEIKDSRKRKSLQKRKQPSRTLLCTLPRPHRPSEPLHALPSHCVSPFSTQATCGLGQYEQHSHLRNHLIGTPSVPISISSTPHRHFINAPSASHQRPIGTHQHLINAPSALHQRPIGISSTPRGTHFAGSLGDSVAQVEDCLDYFKQRVKHFFKTKQDFIPQGKNRQHA